MFPRNLGRGLVPLAVAKTNMPDVVSRSNRVHLDRVRLAKEIEARILMGAKGEARVEYTVGKHRAIVALYDDLGSMYGIGDTTIEALADLAGNMMNVNLEEVFGAE